MPKIKHIEFAGKDGKALSDFYGKLFGWDMTKRNNVPFDYFDFKASDGISGGIRHEPDGPAETVIYLEVDNVSEVVKNAVALGANVRIPENSRGGVTFALIQDPEGNSIGLMEA